MTRRDPELHTLVYLRAGVVATRAYRVVQQQGYLGFEGSTRRDFAKLGGQAIIVMKGLVQGLNGDSGQSAEFCM